MTLKHIWSKHIQGSLILIILIFKYKDWGDEKPLMYHFMQVSYDDISKNNLQLLGAVNKLNFMINKKDHIQKKKEKQ